MANDFLDDTDSAEEDWGSFKEETAVGDLKILNALVARAAEIKAGIKKMEDRTNHGKSLYKDLMETQIPEKMISCGYQVGDSFNHAGVKVELKSDTYCNVPSISAINDEKDDAKRDELIARREAGLSVLEEKAPTLIKRKFEITVDKGDVDQAYEVRHLIETMPNPPEFTEGLSVHPQTLAKWVKEIKATGHAFSPEEEWAFGIFPRKVAKITK
jgi:hypothetical protein